MPAIIPEGSDYDYTAYINMLKMKPMCEELTSTAAPITTVSVNGATSLLITPTSTLPAPRPPLYLTRHQQNPQNVAEASSSTEP